MESLRKGGRNYTSPEVNEKTFPNNSTFEENIFKFRKYGWILPGLKNVVSVERSSNCMQEITRVWLRFSGLSGIVLQNTEYEYNMWLYFRPIMLGKWLYTFDKFMIYQRVWNPKNFLATLLCSTVSFILKWEKIWFANIQILIFLYFHHFFIDQNFIRHHFHRNGRRWILQSHLYTVNRRRYFHGERSISGRSPTSNRCRFKLMRRWGPLEVR